MKDLFDNEEPVHKSPPKAYLAILVLYSISLAFVYQEDISALLDKSASFISEGPFISKVFFALDFLQIAVLIAFFMKKKLSWSFLIILHSLYITIFFRVAYYISSAIGPGFLKVFLADFHPVYYLFNSGVILLLAFSISVTRYLQVSDFQKRTSLFSLLILIPLLWYYYPILR